MIAPFVLLFAVLLTHLSVVRADYPGGVKGCIKWAYPGDGLLRDNRLPYDGVEKYWKKGNRAFLYKHPHLENTFCAKVTRGVKGVRSVNSFRTVVDLADGTASNADLQIPMGKYECCFEPKVLGCAKDDVDRVYWTSK